MVVHVEEDAVAGVDFKKAEIENETLEIRQ